MSGPIRSGAEVADPATAQERLPITAIVASRNEGATLGDCLRGIRFCDEIIVVDLESEDSTSEVARANGARLIRQEALPTIERVRAKVADRARNEWLLFTDPDEVLPSALAREVAALFRAMEPDVALVYAPIQYYFAGRALRGTVWGGPHWRKLLVRQGAAEISPVIYSGARLSEGARTVTLPFSADTAIVHGWTSGYRDLYEKHRRYIEVSAADRALSGETTGLRAIALLPWRSFYQSFFAGRGYCDRLTGLLLSLFWAWFSTRSEIALMRRIRRAAVTTVAGSP